jgi:hypothetical protein
MIGLFSNLTNTINVSRKLNKVNIDNAVCKLHYRFTSVILLVSTIILCGFQYIGDLINCVQDGNSKIPQKLLDTYCFYFGKYTQIF